MSHLLLAEFADPDTLLTAARRARDAGMAGLDAHVPFHVEGLPEALGLRPPALREAMLLSGLATAVLAFAVQWFSAVQDYPLNLGSRPLGSWQAFVIPCFEIGVLAAGFAGLAGLLRGAGLPRPHQPLFAVPGFERASQDRFFLAVDDPAVGRQRLQEALDGLAPLSLHEVG